MKGDGINLAPLRVAVTGGHGFVGAHVVKALRARGCASPVIVRKAHYDLTHENAVRRFYADQAPDVVIHLAGIVGGIGENREHPGRLFYDNLMMGALLIEHGRRTGIRKFVGVGTVCSYPKHAPVPFREDDLWGGYPEESNAAYALAKKMMLVQSQAYRQQYNFNSITLLPVNLYGPGDHFEPRRAHVIPALIKKFVDARDQRLAAVEVWGDGCATREFLYVTDAAEAIVLATERYDDAEPVNVGGGFEISIRDLAAKIADLTAFKGRIVWDTSKPNGQPRRLVDSSRAEQRLGFRASTTFDDGLKATVEWYERVHVARKKAG